MSGNGVGNIRGVDVGERVERKGEGGSRLVAETINQEIDRRYELHARQLATRGDISEMESRLLKAINDSQRWTMGAVLAGMATVAAIVKLL